VKITSVDLELRAIKTLTSNHENERGRMLAMMDGEMFRSNTARLAFERIGYLAREKQHLMTWPELLVDPVLDENARKTLRSYKRKPFRDPDRVKKMIEQLATYRKLRGLAKMSENTLEKIRSAKALDPDLLIERVTDDLTSIRRNFNVDNAFIHIGEASNVKKIVKKILRGEAVKYVPTGFRSFDDRNHGIPQSSLFVIAGPTGGGKTLLSQQVATNMAKSGAKVCYIPLEMEGIEMMQRHISNIGNEDLTNIVNAREKLSLKRRKQIYRRYMKLDKKYRRLGAQLSYFNPPEDMTIEELLFLLRPYGYDVIIIDYIGLLKGVDGDDQWRALGKAARFARMFALNNKTTIILNAQLSEEGVIRYSKAVKEHASVMWTWQKDQLAAETGIMEIVPQKARMMDPTPFYLKFVFEKMRVRDLTDEEKSMLTEDGDGGERDDDEQEDNKKVKSRKIRGRDKKGSNDNQANDNAKKKYRGESGKKKKANRFGSVSDAIEDEYFDLGEEGVDE
jgi:archaellum biogenesis ATPase FlaH